MEEGRGSEETQLSCLSLLERLVETDSEHVFMHLYFLGNENKQQKPLKHTLLESGGAGAYPFREK